MAAARHAPLRGLQRRRCRCSARDCAPSRRCRCRARAATAAPPPRPRRRRSSRRPCAAHPRRSWWCRTAGCRSESRRTVRAHWSCPGSPRRPRAAGRPGWHPSRATLSLSGGWLDVVASPATSNASLMVMGTPCERPEPGGLLAALALARARSAARAAFIAPSRSTTTRALRGPLRRAIRCKCILVASTELRRPFRMARASRVAVSKHGSMHVSPAAAATLAAPQTDRL